MPKIGCSLELPTSGELKEKHRFRQMFVASIALLSVVLIFFKARK
ncbi:MAG: hypothetical protein ACYCSG_00790 [Thermoplasmataceae archaeon]